MGDEAEERARAALTALSRHPAEGYTRMKAAIRSSANAGAAMSISGPPPDKAVLFSHANAMSVRLSDAVTIDGNFSTFRETGGWDSSTDGVAVAMNALNNLAGRAGNSSKRVDMAVDLDGPATARMSLSALADFNAAIAQRLAP